MRKITAAAVTIGVAGATLVGLVGAAGATAAGATAAGATAAGATAAGATAAGATAAGATAAGAAPDAPNGVIKLPTTSYTSPSNQSVRVHTLEPGTRVETLCFTEGQTLNNNFYWFRILQGGDLGFVHRDAIAAPQDLRHC